MYACVYGLYLWLVCQYLYSMACYTRINNQKFPIWGNRMLPKLPRFYFNIKVVSKGELETQLDTNQKNANSKSAMAYTRPRKRQKTSHAHQSVMLMTTLSLMSQYSRDDAEERPTKRRRTNEHIAYTHSFEETCAAEAMLCLARS